MLAIFCSSGRDMAPWTASIFAASARLGGRPEPRQLHCASISDRDHDRGVYTGIEKALKWVLGASSSVFPRIPFYRQVRARVAEHEGWLAAHRLRMIGRRGEGDGRRGRGGPGATKGSAKGAGKGLQGRCRSPSHRVPMRAEQGQASKRKREEGCEEEEEEEEEGEDPGDGRSFADPATIDDFLVLASSLSGNVRTYLLGKAAKHAAEAAEEEAGCPQTGTEDGQFDVVRTEQEEAVVEEEKEKEEEVVCQLGSGGGGGGGGAGRALGGGAGGGVTAGSGRAQGRLARNCPFVDDLPGLAQALGVNLANAGFHLLRAAQGLGVNSPMVLLDLLLVGMSDMRAVLSILGRAERATNAVEDMNAFVGALASGLRGNLGIPPLVH